MEASVVSPWKTKEQDVCHFILSESLYFIGQDELYIVKYIVKRWVIGPERA